MCLVPTTTTKEPVHEDHYCIGIERSFDNICKAMETHEKCTKNTSCAWLKKGDRACNENVHCEYNEYCTDENICADSKQCCTVRDALSGECPMDCLHMDGCTSHEHCSEGHYCSAFDKSCYYDEFCCSRNDSIDGECPNSCENVVMCDSHDTCGENEFCSNNICSSCDQCQLCSVSIYFFIFRQCPEEIESEHL